jgi:hypothetical protein
MMPNHTVEDGEHFPKIAAEAGFRNYRRIWDGAENKAIRDKRKTPSILMPGDEVFLPEPEEGEESGASDRRHVFQLTIEPLKLKLRLLDLDDRPVADKACLLEIEGATLELKTKADGVLEHTIPHTAQRGKLTIDDLAIPLQIGFLHPIEEVSGWRARLNNLGYNAGDSDDPEDPQLRSAVEEFQCEYMGPAAVDGICGEKTQKKLKEMHGC